MARIAFDDSGKAPTLRLGDKVRAVFTLPEGATWEEVFVPGQAIPVVSVSVRQGVILWWHIDDGLDLMGEYSGKRPAHDQSEDTDGSAPQDGRVVATVLILAEQGIEAVLELLKLEQENLEHTIRPMPGSPIRERTYQPAFG
jgi:hypothetical protein